MSKFKGLKTAKNQKMLSSLWSLRKELPNMFSAVFRGEYRLSFMTILAMVFALLYIVSPIDVIPDFIPVAGWLDDGVVFYWLLKRLLSETEKFLSKNKESMVYVIE